MTNATARRDAALSLYGAACDAPASADWRAVADALRAALPAARTPREATPAAWWQDYALGKTYELASMVFRFADGVEVRCNVARNPGKPWRVVRAARVAICFWEARTGSYLAPEFTDVVRLDSNGAVAERYDARAVNRRTAEYRDLPPAPPAPDLAGRVARLEAELERRRVGFRRAQQDAAYSSAGLDEWHCAIRAAEAELARARAALAGTPVVATVSYFAAVEPEQASPPVERIAAAAEPIASDCSGLAPRDLSSDFAPAAPSIEPANLNAPEADDVDSHPVTVLCTSLAAVLTVRDRTGGEWIDAPQRRGIRWTCRVTAADALLLDGVRGVKLIGRARKPRSPGAAIPAAPEPVRPAAPARPAPSALARRLLASSSAWTISPGAARVPAFAALARV